MYLGQYEGKNIRITLRNGKIFEGIGEWYTQDIDNPDGIASICVGYYELYENEIVSIELMPETAPAAVLSAVAPDIA